MMDSRETTGITGTAITGDILLDVRHLSVDYQADAGDVHAVTDVSFALRRGEILGLAGESGSGKSTLAYALARLLRPPAVVTAGQVLYSPGVERQAARTSVHGGRRGRADGVDNAPLDILRLTPAQLRAFRWNDLAIVFQSAMNALNPVMTIGAQIVDVLAAHRPELSRGQRYDRAAELVRLVGIAPDRLISYPHELSGGMRQRATIAIALALSPDIIIMDEPTTALDVVVQHEILTEILRLRAELRFAVIFITHDLSLLLELADTIAIMYAGRIVEYGARRELAGQPRHPYSYGLLHSFPNLRGPRRTVLGIPGAPPDLRDVPPGCSFHPRCPFAFAPCSTTLPLLRPATTQTSAEEHQQVACHLYDPAFAPAPPAEELLAAGYAALVRE
ncbi:MAG TPA: ABC transporter ATP-binding protein [Ktedonobacterales bacterium]|jgi:peptide/nickel transport system ATP-binding protein|nr:ABC transporter ATP-binding protein [Ktedonobacterales bacterium]